MVSREFDLASLLHAKTKQCPPEQMSLRKTDFCGRESILDTVLTSLEPTSRVPGLLVTGEPGTGKTALCVELVEPTQDKSASIAKQVLWHWYCQTALTTLSSQANVSRFVRHMARDLCNSNLVPEYRLALQADSLARHTLEPRSCNADPDEAFRQGIILPLASLGNPPTERCLVIVDGVNATCSVARLLAKHHHLFPNWLVLLVTSRSDPAVVDSFHGFQEIHLNATSDDQIASDAQRFILRRIDQDKNLRQGLTRLAAENINEIRVRSDGCFLYLDLVMDAAARGDISFSDMMTVPDSLDEAYGLWADFLCGDKRADERLVGLAFSVMTAAARPLTESELYEAMWTKISTITVEQLQYQLRLVEKFVGFDAKGKLRFVHPSFPEWLCQSNSALKCCIGDGHAALAVRYSNHAQSLNSIEVKEFALHILRGNWNPSLTKSQMASWLILSRAKISDTLTSSVSSCDVEDVVDLLTMAGAKSGIRATPSVPSSLNDDNFSTSTGLTTDSHRSQSVTQSSLIVAAANGDLEGLAALIDSGVNINAKGRGGRAALNVAVREGHRPVVAYLVTRNADVNLADDDGWTPLRTTASLNHLEIAVYLLEFSPVIVDVADNEGRTPLRAVAWSGYLALAREFLSKGADPNRQDNLGRTPLIAAAYQGHVEIVRHLIAHGALVNHVDNEGRTALSVAGLCTASTSRAIADLLLKARADVDAEDRHEMTPLSVAAYEGNIRVAEALLEAGANPNHVDRTGKTPLLATTANGHADLVKLLLFWSPRLEQEDQNGRSLLTLAASSGNVDVVDALIDIGLNVNHVDRQGWPPLTHAVCVGSESIVCRLLAHGAKTSQRDVEGLTILQVACQAGQARCAKLLIQAGMKVNAVSRGGATALRLAALAGRLDILELLVAARAQINLIDKDRRTTLYAVAAQGLPDVARYLLKNGADPNVRDKDGRTAMHVAAWHGYEDLVQVLVSHRGNVNQFDRDGLTPLHAAAWKGNTQAITALLDWGAWIDEESEEGATALGIACQEGHLDAVHVLLMRGASPIKPDGYGLAPIEIARQYGRTAIAKVVRDFLDGKNGTMKARREKEVRRLTVDWRESSDDTRSASAEFGGRPASRSSEEYKVIMNQVRESDMLFPESTAGKPTLKRTPSGGRSKAAALLNIFRKKDEKQIRN